MSATTAPDEVISGCKELLALLDVTGWPGGTPVSDAIMSLRDVTETYGLIAADRLHEADEYPEVTGHLEAKWEALKLAAQDAEDCAAEVARLLEATTEKWGQAA